jgi:GH24 family phage-related lysozyme (muramidase)
MKINDAGIELIKSFEGCRLAAYKCPAGVWTIGYGHTAGVYEGMVISQAQADNMLKSDLKKYEKYVTDNVKLPLNENQFSALVSFTYNCGVGNLRTLIKNRNTNQIADAMILYNKASGKVLSGLVRRREAERKLFLKSVANSVPEVNVVVNYLPRYSGNNVSIVQALKSVGVDSSYSYRKKLAVANGIKDYTGTASQNLKLLDLLKAGKLVRA